MTGGPFGNLGSCEFHHDARDHSQFHEVAILFDKAGVDRSILHGERGGMEIGRNKTIREQDRLGQVLRGETCMYVYERGADTAALAVVRSQVAGDAATGREQLLAGRRLAFAMSGVPVNAGKSRRNLFVAGLGSGLQGSQSLLLGAGILRCR